MNFKPALKSLKLALAALCLALLVPGCGQKDKHHRALRLTRKHRRRAEEKIAARVRFQ
jgi:outer membrane lipoprotein-sorting protein